MARPLRAGVWRERWDKANRALGNVAGDGRGTIQIPLTDPIGEQIDEIRHVRLWFRHKAGNSLFGASGSATIAASVTISIPKPGSIVSILSTSNRDIRLASRSGSAVPTRTAWARLSTRWQTRSSRRAPSPFSSSASQSWTASLLIYRAMVSQRQSARRRRGGPRSGPAGGSVRSGRRSGPPPGPGGGRARVRNAT
jgi:hypothetical protein